MEVLDERGIAAVGVVDARVMVVAHHDGENMSLGSTLQTL
jgi:hypothetical protein